MLLRMMEAFIELEKKRCNPIINKQNTRLHLKEKSK